MTQKCIPTTTRRCKHKGNAIVLLIVLALFAVIAVYFLNVATGDPVGPVDQCPWVEEARIVEDYSAINLPQAPQFVTEDIKLFIYEINSDEGQRRGRLNIELTPDGFIAAVWKAKYKEGEFEKEVSATCGGNVDATMLYEDENGADDSKLFFITKGKYIVQAFKHGNAKLGGGEAYVVGWILPDGSANGTLVLALDKKNPRIYKWGK